MQGFLPKFWQTILAISYYTIPTAPIMNTSGGGPKVLHRVTTDIWSGQNEALHDQQASKELELQTLVDAEIQKLNSDPEHLLTANTHYATAINLYNAFFGEVHQQSDDGFTP